MEAIALGKNCLSQQVGDVRQPSVVKLGSPIRAAVYGFASGLMDPRSSENVTEYHRNNADAHQQLTYTSHDNMVPICVRPELMVTNIAQLSEEDRVSLAKQTILAIFDCTWDNVRTFDNDTERSWMLIVALTRFWAKYQQSNRLMQKADRVIKSMVYSFVTCFSRVHSDSQARPSLISRPTRSRIPTGSKLTTRLWSGSVCTPTLLASMPFSCSRLKCPRLLVSMTVKL